jgi:N-acetylneuraminate synthase
VVKTIHLQNWEIGPERPCFIIAEAGVNHNGRMDLAKALIDSAVQAGADAVKFQTFKTEKLVTIQAPQANYQIQSTGLVESQFEMIKRLELSYAQFQELYEYCQQQKILFLSSPFDEESADFLESLGVVAFKIGSGEITNFPLLTHVAQKNKPVLLSTGMSYLGEVEAAVRTIYDTGNDKLALFHCTSDYPAVPSDVNLRAMHTLSGAFGVPVGYSDHTEGNEISFAAVALGACILERHFTLDKKLYGPDHRASLEPQEFEALVKGVRKIESAFGDGRKIPALSELNTVLVARKSLVAARDILANTLLTDELIEIKRPGTGLPPSMKPAILGRKTRVLINSGDLIKLENLE